MGDKTKLTIDSFINIPFVNLPTIPIISDFLNTVSQSDMEKFKVFVES
jgi:hypothetical protein